MGSGIVPVMYGRIPVFGRRKGRKAPVPPSLRCAAISASWCVAVILFTLPRVLAQQDTLLSKEGVTGIGEVEITGHRTQAAFSVASRIITSISGEEIEKSGMQSMQDLLEFASNVDVRQRGAFGVQSDISIRGGSFDHVQVLVNGIPLGDPQTGHASLDVPLDKESIDRIEILEGSGARVLGAGAFTGAVNIVTRKGETTRVAAGQSLGSHGFLRTHVDAGGGGDLLHHFFSAGISSSKGYIPDTDFRLLQAYYRADLSKDHTRVDFQAGMQQKKFGAAGYYSPRFPDQYEETGLFFAGIRASAGSRVRISPSLYWRHRTDHYVLVRDDPAFYQNFHLTDLLGSQLNFNWQAGPFRSVTGMDLRSENILSNNLGFENPDPVPVRGEDSAYYTKSYGRVTMALFQEFALKKSHLDASGGFMVSWNSAYPGKPLFFPGIDISYRLPHQTRIYASVNRALHFPTFTDLFYTDPVHQGNLHLNPNRMVSLEGGLKYDGKLIKGHIALFRNEGKDIIDWLWSYGQQRFSPVNLRKFRSSGLEIGAELRAGEGLPRWSPFRALSVHYAYLDIRKSLPDSVSKYDNLRHKLSVTARHALIKNMELVWSVSYQDRAGESVGYDMTAARYHFTAYHPFWLLNGSVKWNPGIFVVDATVSNILDTEYIDAGSVRQPGRWIRVGIAVKLEKK